MEFINLRESVKKLNAILNLKRNIVGVKFLFTEEEFQESDAPVHNNSMFYCLMIKKAMGGESMKVRGSSFSCMGSVRSLGLKVPDEFFTSGRHYARSGIYQDLTIAKSVAKNMTVCNHMAYGLMIKPLEEFQEKPDIVLIVAKPMEAMRIIQGYTYKFGTNSQLKMSGNQAVCSECTAYPFESNDINVSVLCGGTRAVAKWDESELGIGFPFNRFHGIVEGVWETMNPQESNQRKKIIEKKLANNNITDLKVEYNQNYYRKRK
ncbi:MAG: DUF169 domain-containing protein [Clostridiaceae bacterium]|nr:DUF169 domain-containing protein [Clostridiaceae bacterium]